MVKKLKKPLLWHMGTLFLFLFLSLHLTTTAYAVPADPSPKELRQADGTAITGYACGDEFFNWFEDSDNNIIAYDSDSGNWCYAYVRDNMLLPGSEVVGKDSKSRSNNNKIQREDILEIIESNVKSSPLYTDAINARASGASVYTQNESASRAATFPKTNQELLLLLVEFNDAPIQKDGQYWNAQYFGDGKSVAQYYKDMSEGLNIFIPAATQNIGLHSEVSTHVRYDGTDEHLNKISWANDGVSAVVSSEFDGVIKVSFDMPHPIPRYISLNDNSNYQQLAIVTLAMKAIKETTDYDFSDFGVKKQVAVIVAGSEYSCGVFPDLAGEVWAHSFHFDGMVVGLNGRELPYMIHGEMYDETTPQSIGVPCHELGHILGLPDLYKPSNPSSGVGYYSLMALGSWGAVGDEIDGTTPVALDAWSKYMLGYVVPIECEDKIYDVIEVNSAGVIGAAGSNNYNVLKLNNIEVDDKQYFLIENRQDNGWDAGMECYFRNDLRRGILILQIDENIEFGQGINDMTDHRGVNVVGTPPVDNSGSINCFYAANTNGLKDRLTPDSTPINSMFYFYTESRDPTLSTRDEPSNITVHIKSNSSESMVVEVGVDSDITDEILDPNFLTAVRTASGKDTNEPIIKSDLFSITSLDISNGDIYALDGVEYLRKLKELYCYGNELQSLDMSSNPELEILDCSYNFDLVVLNVTKNAKLRELDCNSSTLSTLDISHNRNLISLICFDGQIEELNLTYNTKLEQLEAWRNRLTTLDVSHNPNLTYLDCGYNYMSSPDDVRGWQEIGLILEENFLFDPQEEIVED